MTILLTIIKTEIIKTKNSFAFWLVILGSAFIPFFFGLHHVFEWNDYIPHPGENPWFEFFRKGLNGVHFIFLPMFIVILLALLLNIEHKSIAWKHLFVLPVSKTKIFISKYLLSIGLLLLFYVLSVIFFFGGAVLLSAWKGEFGFLHYYPLYSYALVKTPVYEFFIKSFISSLALLSIHFWISFRIKNMFLNIGIGLAGVVLAVSIYIPHWPSIIYLPYAYPVLMCNFIPDANNFLSNFHVNSLIYFSIVTLLSYFDFVKYYKG